MKPRTVSLPLSFCWLAVASAFAVAAEPTRQQRVAALPEEDRVWVTEFVAPIILPEEERVFLQLTDAAQREGFRENFWQRRETPGLPPPLGPGYRDRYRNLRGLVDEKYDGWQNDAGRLVLRRGEPDSVFKPRCSGEEVFRDLEVWTYNGLDLNGHAAARHIFYRPASGAPRRLWIVHDANAVTFRPNACRSGFDRLSWDCRPNPEDRCGRCEDRCVVYEVWADIMKRQGSPAGAVAERAALFDYPKIPAEGLDRSKARWAAAAASTTRAPVTLGTAISTQTPAPTLQATRPPTLVPTPPPTRPPTPPPTQLPTRQPTPAPAILPTRQPAVVPTPQPTRQPTLAPTPAPTSQPAAAPAPPVTRQLTLAPSPSATRQPTSSPLPTAARSPVPTRTPTAAPPTPVPTPRPATTLKPTQGQATAAERLRKLSAEETRERIDTLEPEYKEFLELARPLMTEEELSRFLQISGHDKDAFIREFWKRHS